MATTSSIITNFLGVTTLKTSFTSSPAIFSYLEAKYLSNCESVSPSAYAPSMLTFFWGFSHFLQPDLFVSEDTDVESACIGNTFPKKASASIGAVEHSKIDSQSP